MSLKQKIQQKAIEHEHLRQYFKGKASIPYLILTDENTNYWVNLSDVLGLLSEHEEKLQKLLENRPMLLVTHIVNEQISEELWNKLWEFSNDLDEYFLRLEKELKP